jgi:hypothetical protein
MRRLTAVEIAILVLALLAVISGIEIMRHPAGAVVLHQVRRYGYKLDYISKTEAKVYGASCILFGLILIRLVFYSKRR